MKNINTKRQNPQDATPVYIPKRSEIVCRKDDEQVGIVVKVHTSDDDPPEYRAEVRYAWMAYLYEEVEPELILTNNLSPATKEDLQKQLEYYEQLVASRLDRWFLGEKRGEQKTDGYYALMCGFIAVLVIMLFELFLLLKCLG